MKNLKLRAWTIKHNCWHYFNLFTLVNGDIDRDGDGFLNYEHWCEYIGLKDKNGKEIYEGDIVRNKYGWVGYIEYDCSDGIPEYYLHPIKRDLSLVLTRWQEWGELEVISNIYENQELLKENK